ncbi:hypothetical protein [Caenispirillum salinarum]|uniref:hypothetical protein n=1 Tax=Caenispirillum salinarum TaxID=859058 RepID=UPI00384CE6E1
MIPTALNPALWQPQPTARLAAADGKAVAAGTPEGEGARAPSLLDGWESTRRQMQEEFMARRLETADMIMEALRPTASLWMMSGSLARAVAGTVEHLSAEINAVVRDMEQEFGRRALPGEPFAERKGFTDLFGQASRALTGASFLALTVGASFDRGPLNQASGFERAMGAARHLDDASTRLTALHARHGAALSGGGINLSA